MRNMKIKIDQLTVEYDHSAAASSMTLNLIRYYGVFVRPKFDFYKNAADPFCIRNLAAGIDIFFIALTWKRLPVMVFMQHCEVDCRVSHF